MSSIIGYAHSSREDKTISERQKILEAAKEKGSVTVLSVNSCKGSKHYEGKYSGTLSDLEIGLLLGVNFLPFGGVVATYNGSFKAIIYTT